MNAVRLLALDLDDTLLRSDLSISRRSKNAVKKAAAAGVTVVLASGRSLAAMEHYAVLLGMNKQAGYLICSNGSIIRDSLSGEIMYDICIERKAALAAFDLADAKGFAVQIYEGDIMYVSKENEYTAYDYKLTGLRQVVVENFRAMAAGGCRKMIVPGDPLLLNPLEKLFRSIFNGAITLFTSKPYFLEILPANTDKGTSLEKIAGLLNIRREEVLAIGDSMNDEAMIRWAGTGVAMANSDERIKKIADLVTEKNNDDDGVAEIIEKYILEKPAAKNE